MAQVKSGGNNSTEQTLLAVFRSQGIVGWRRGSRLPGNPDFVFRGKKVAVFVDGCFWHGHRTKCRLPKTNRLYWAQKIERNVKRDRLVSKTLRQMGWNVIRVWEHKVKQQETLARISEALT